MCQTATNVAIVTPLFFSAASSWGGVVLIAIRYGIEAGGLVYSFAFMFAAVRYLFMHSQPEVAPAVGHGAAPAPRVAIIYLCCGDLETEALYTLSNLKPQGCSALLHILHDDSCDPAANMQVDQAVARIERETGVQWRVLRRTDKNGGKAGVLNTVLEFTAPEHDLFMLCDNDSYADDSGLVARAVVHFADERVSIVQFRNMTRVMPGEAGFTAYLAGAIEIFDVFMTGLYRLMWTPFVGHNAMLRTRDVVRVGGATPGFFADDIDLTVRLNLIGKRVIYRRDLRMSEGHPPNYRSFCLRAQKWASGCGQIIRTHMMSVLASREFSLREKAGFLLFCGFYATQGAMLLYMLLVFIVLPLQSEESWDATATALLVATLLPTSIFAAVAVYLRTEGRSLPFWRTLLACAGTYGSTDFWTMRGLLRGITGRAGHWVPTNSVSRAGGQFSAWAHFSVGVICLLVPALKQPVLLLCPMTWIFASKYIFVPAVEQYYRPIIQPNLVVAREYTSRQTGLSSAILWIIAMLGILSSPPEAGAQIPQRVEVRGERLLIDGDAITIKAVHFSPWRSGAGPGKGMEYPARELVTADLDLIASLNANTILAYDPPGWVAEVASEKRLNLIYVFNVPWWKVAEGKTPEIASELSTRIAEMKGHRAIIAWMMGNEAPGWVIDKMGADGLRSALSMLRQAARSADAGRPVCYGNWPLAVTLDLDREMDIVTYNVYPFYPTEVPAAGYGNYIRERIMPLAKGRPVIISEFGVNTIEVSPQRQAEVLGDCWRGILAAGAQGGVVFEFADEWWKNYDNPVSPPDWWRRQPAPDDHLVENHDPEEHYGIFDAKRTPKPAAAAVRSMFASLDRPAKRALTFDFTPWWPLGGIGLMVAFALAMFIRGLSRRKYVEGKGNDT